MAASLPCARSLAEPEPAAPPAAPAPTVEAKPVVSGPAAPQPVVQATVPSEQPALSAPAPVEAPPPPPPPAPPPPPKTGPTLKIGLGIRTGLALTANSPAKHAKLALHDGVLDSVTFRPYMSSQLTDHIAFTANLDVETSGINLLDAILQIKFIDELQLWIGQHIPAQDRNNNCGPFFANAWNFALNVHNYPMDFAARDRGFTFWGLIAGGILKYRLSMVDLMGNRNIANARYGASVTLNFLGKENYYYASGTYFGAQDVLAIGGAIQYQNGPGEKGDNDFVGGSADLLFEKNMGGGGTLTIEMGYWNFNKTGKNYKPNIGVALGTGHPTNATQFFGPPAGQTMLAQVSWLTPMKVGIGQLQPNFRLQWGDKDAGDFKVYDAGLAYVIDGFNHKWHLNYRHVDPASGKATDMIQLGAQLQI